MPEKKKFADTDKRSSSRGKGDASKREKPAAGKYPKRDAGDSRDSDRAGADSRKPTRGGDRERSSGKKFESGEDRPSRGGKRSFEDKASFKPRREEDADRGSRKRSEGGEERSFKGGKRSFEDKPSFKPRRNEDSDSRGSRTRSEGGEDRPFKGGKRSFEDKPSFKSRRNEDSDSRGSRKRSEGGEDRPFSDRRKSFDDRDSFKTRRNDDNERGSRKRAEGSEDRPFSDRKSPFEDRGSRTHRNEESDSKGFRKRRDESEGEDRPQRRRKDFDGDANDRPSRRDSDSSDFRGRKKYDSDERSGSTRNTRPSRSFDRNEDEGDERPSFRERPDDRRFKSNRVGREYKPFKEFKEPKRYKGKNEEENTKGDEMPLNKFIAHSGECSRRDAAELVKQGKVKVNDVLILDPGHKVMRGDTVSLSGKKLALTKGLVYILLNKPKGYITTTDDEKGRRTVIDIVQDAAEGSRLFPVGRLDRNTTGLLLITNDGALAQKLSHPSFKAKKIYQVTLDKALTKADFDRVLEGVTLEDGEAHADALSYLEHRNELGIEIHSGKNRIVRRIFESMGYEVEKLDRMMYAGLTKKNLPRGKWRYLNEREIVLLKHFKS